MYPHSSNKSLSAGFKILPNSILYLVLSKYEFISNIFGIKPHSLIRFIPGASFLLQTIFFTLKFNLLKTILFNIDNALEPRPEKSILKEIIIKYLYNLQSVFLFYLSLFQ